MALPIVESIKAHRYEGGVISPAEVRVSAEYHFTLSVNGSMYVRLACSGGDLRELATGYLYAEGIIDAAGDVRGFSVDEKALEIDVQIADEGRLKERLSSLRTVTSSSGMVHLRAGRSITGTPVFPGVRADTVIGCMDEFLNKSEIHDTTHGVHSAALYRADGERLVFFDEIGRHNAVDKVLGWTLSRGSGFEGRMLLTTGRMASEIVSKIVAAGVPAIVSRAAPTTKSVEISRRHNILMIGSVRRSGFTIFNGMERVLC